MAAAGFFFFSSRNRRQVAGAILLRCFSHFPFSAPPPAPPSPPVCRFFSSEPCRRRAGLLSPLPLPDNSGSAGFGVELVDPDLWHISSALSQVRGFPQAAASKVFDETSKRKAEGAEGEGDGDNFPDLDEIEELRLRKKLFYKLDRGSMEFEECSLSLFRRQKSKSKRKQLPESRDSRSSPEPRKKGTILETGSTKPSNRGCDAWSTPASAAAAAPRAPLEEQLARKEKKRERTPTFNQLTDPYHLPFCLDIYVSKGSVRACVVHRATSKVVAVAHSISKDMKFDLASRRDAAACAAVGAALAQRALSDDIHNVVYTPRKGEKIEGKLQVVLQAIVEGGVDVQVKLKQRNLRGRATAASSSGELVG
ncbi:hypothetical protein Taro_038182 [Colocasia esculenta]|uniref:Uncharacterized protein n=1 Tax=Colocasia esculenta TaxID=4460 RepID=A0A843WD67_COLES|nr:hypothetical protein [Colocasia esculenta]